MEFDEDREELSAEELMARLNDSSQFPLLPIRRDNGKTELKESGSGSLKNSTKFIFGLFVKIGDRQLLWLLALRR